MKRIAAIIATTFAVLAIPATAMASTSSAGSGSGNSGYVNPGGPRLVVCPLPRGVHVKPTSRAVQIRYANGRVAVVYKKLPPGQFRFRCPLPWRQPKPPVQVCAPGTVNFFMPPSSGTFTESSGPQLYPGEKFYYNDTMYTVASVSASVFTLDANGARYVNGGVSAPNAIATAVCAGSSIGN